MCGRFVAASPPDQIARYFDAQAPEALLAPSYNVAPTNDVYAVLEDGSSRRVEALHWGLVPRWAKDPSVGNRMINARAETLAAKNAYKHAFAKRRCIIPADGFYEWQAREGRPKQPMYIRLADGEPLALAGLWEAWRDPDAADDDEQGWLRSCVIVTTDANELLVSIHDRMPVVLPEGAWDTWLDPSNHDTAALAELLRSAVAEWFEAYPVSTRVNRPSNNGPELLERITPSD
jgi:putative SOS response-associated peptidase YedK